MADVGKVTYKIRGDNSSFEKDVGESKHIASRAASAIGSAFATAMAAAGVAIAAAVSKGVEISATQETALAAVKTIMDETVVSAEDMSAGLTALSNETGKAYEDLAASAYNAISATGDTAGALQLIASASDLATAGLTNQESALSVLTTAINAYKLSSEDAAAISDSLIATQNLGVLTIDQLSGSMGKAISTASAYNVNLGNLESAYVSLTKAGIGVDESTTYLSSMLNELGDSGSAVGKVLSEKTGKSFSELIASGYSLGDVLGVLSESVDGDSSAMMNLWGSMEAGKASNAIMSQGLEAFNDNLATIQGSTGATEAAVTTMSDTFEYQFDRLKTAATNTLGDVMTGFKDIAKDEAIPYLIDKLGELQSAFEEGGFEGLAEAAGDILGELAAKLVEALPEITEASIGILNSIVEGITENQDLLTTSAFDIITALTEGIITMLPNLITLALSLILGIVQGIADNASMLIDGAYAIITALVDGITTILPALIPAVIQIILAVVDALTSPDNLIMLIEAAVELVLALAEGLIEAIPDLLEVVPRIISNLVEMLISPKFIAMLINAGVRIIFALIEGIINTITGVVASGQTLIESLNKVFTDSIKGWIETGKNIVSGIWEGIESSWNTLVKNITDKVGGLIKSVKKMFGINSPSTVFKGIFVNVVKGSEVGLDDEFPNLERKINTRYGGLMDGISAESAVTPAAAINGAGAAPVQIEIPLTVDGREIARATAFYTSEQMSWLGA